MTCETIETTYPSHDPQKQRRERTGHAGALSLCGEANGKRNTEASKRHLPTPATEMQQAGLQTMQARHRAWAILVCVLAGWEESRLRIRGQEQASARAAGVAVREGCLTSLLACELPLLHASSMEATDKKIIIALQHQRIEDTQRLIVVPAHNQRQCSHLLHGQVISGQILQRFALL